MRRLIADLLLKSSLSQFFVMFMSVVLLLMLITSNPAGGMTNGWRIVYSIAFGVVGLIYYLLRKHASKRLLGIVSVVAGAVSNWYQLGKLTAKASVQGRLFFLAAGVAVMADGFKKIADGGE